MGATQSLKIAIKENDLEGVVNAINNGADLYAKDKNGRDWPAYARHKRRPDLAVYVELKHWMQRINDYNTILPDGSTILTQAAQWGLYPLIEELLTVHRNVTRVDFPDSAGSTALLRACEFGQGRAIAVLLKYGASPLQCNKWLQSPLYFAVSTFHGLPTGGVALDATLSALQSQGSSGLLPSANSFSVTPSLTLGTSVSTLVSSVSTTSTASVSTSRNDDDATSTASSGPDWSWAGEYPVSALLMARADVNVATTTGVTPLMKAVTDGAPLAVIQALLTARALVNVQNSSGDSPLTLAIERGRGDVVELLVASRAQLQLMDAQGFAPLAKAVLNDHIGIARTLLRARADPNIRSLKGATPLILAAEAGGRLAMIDLLLERDNLAVNARDYSGATALMKAIAQDDFEIAQMLLDRGASLLTTPVESDASSSGLATNLNAPPALDESLMKLMDEAGAVVVFYGPSAPRISIPREIFEVTQTSPSAKAFRASEVFRTLQARGIDGSAQAYLWVSDHPVTTRLMNARLADPEIAARRAEALRQRRGRVVTTEVIRRVLRSETVSDLSEVLPTVDVSASATTGNAATTTPGTNSDAALNPSSEALLAAAGTGTIRIVAGARPGKAGKPGGPATVSKKVGELLGLHAGQSVSTLESLSAAANDASLRSSRDSGNESISESRASGITPTATYAFEFTDYDAIDTTTGGMVLGQSVNTSSSSVFPASPPHHQSTDMQAVASPSTSSILQPSTDSSSVASSQDIAAKSGRATTTPTVVVPSFLKNRAASHHQHTRTQSQNRVPDHQDSNLPRHSLPTHLESVSEVQKPQSDVADIPEQDRTLAVARPSPPRIPPRTRRGSASLSQVAMEAAQRATTFGTPEHNPTPPTPVRPEEESKRGLIPRAELPVTPSSQVRQRPIPPIPVSPALSTSTVLPPESVYAPSVTAPPSASSVHSHAVSVDPVSQQTPQPNRTTIGSPAITKPVPVPVPKAELPEPTSSTPPPPPPPMDPSQDPRLWRRAVDPGTTFAYYYNVRTKESIWHIPTCVRAVEHCAECNCTTLAMDSKKIAFCLSCQHWHG